jgi:hypothetical protein
LKLWTRPRFDRGDGDGYRLCSGDRAPWSSDAQLVWLMTSFADFDQRPLPGAGRTIAPPTAAFQHMNDAADDAAVFRPLNPGTTKLVAGARAIF